MTQICERVFRDSLTALADNGKEVYHIKLMSNPLAFHKSPADFLVLTTNFRYLVECKEINCRIKSEAFGFDRLTQKSALLEFNGLFPSHVSYVMLLFRLDRLDKSHCYFLPIRVFEEIMNSVGKKSLRFEDLERMKMENYKLSVAPGSTFDLSRFIL